MRVYTVRCPNCLWETPLPVDSTVAEGFRRSKFCQGCKKVFDLEVPWEIKEKIVVGPTRFFPGRKLDA